MSADIVNKDKNTQPNPLSRRECSFRPKVGVNRQFSDRNSMEQLVLIESKVMISEHCFD